MKLPSEQFERFDRRLQAVEEGQRKLEREIANVKQAITDSQARIILWVVALFIGSTIIIATLSGVYISVLLAS